MAFLPAPPVVPPPSPLARRLLLGAAGLALFCDFALFGVISPLLPLMFAGETHHISDAALDRLFMSKAVVQLACGTFAGYGVDRAGPQASLAVGLIVLAIASFMFAGSVANAGNDHERYWAMMIWRSLQGVASAVIGPSCFAMVALLRKASGEAGQEGQSDFGLVGLGALLGMVLGPMMAALVGVSPGFPFAVIGLGCIFVLVVHGCALCCLRLPDFGAGHEEAFQGLRSVVRDPYLYCILAPVLTCVSVEALITVAQPLRLSRHVVGFEVGGVVAMFGILGAAAMASSFLYGPLLGAKLTSQWHILLGNIVMGLGLVGVFICGEARAIGMGNAMVGASMTPIRTGAFVLLAALVEFRGLKAYGFAMSCQDMANCLGYVMGPLLASVVNDHYRAVPVIVGIVLAVTAILPWLAWPVEAHRLGLLPPERLPVNRHADAEKGGQYRAAPITKGSS